MQNIKEKLIVALDVDKLDKAAHFVDILSPAVKLFKIGSQLYTASGPDSVKMVIKKGASVFLDLKFHDIPNTVCFAVASGMGMSCEITSLDAPTDNRADIEDKVLPGVFMMTVHIQGGKKMLEAAVRGAADKAKELRIERPLIVGVTVLTSDEQEDTAKLVLERADLAHAAGLDGVVCSVHEAAAVRRACGKNFIIVTPGIRPQGADAQDQKRVATASQALKAGADFIVVGRPILEASNPLKAARDILAELG
jgi:orotidine-5'-phosphate decarboxylase